jgi:hypothetical protein
MDRFLPDEYRVVIPSFEGGRRFLPQICLTDLVHLATETKDAGEKAAEAAYLLSHYEFVDRVLYRESPSGMIRLANQPLPQRAAAYVALGKSALAQLHDVVAQEDVLFPELRESLPGDKPR